MWKNNRYVGTRDPSRGGLYISATTDEFERNHKREIYDNCLEMIVKEQGNSCASLYPLQDGMYSLAMGYKVSGSLKESRPHEVIRGIVFSKDELLDFCEQYIAEGCLQEIFFPEPPNPNKPEEWYMLEDSIEEKILSKMGSFWSLMDYKEILGVYNAIKRIKERNLKIQLLIQDKKKDVVFAAICIMAIHANANLFVMKDGECTLTLPDLVIVDQLRYLDERRYKCLTWKQFVELGNNPDDVIEQEFKEEYDELTDLLGLCEEYLYTDEITDCELYQQLDEFLLDNPKQYIRFKTKLKRILYHLRRKDYCIEHYMKLLYIAFQMDFDTGKIYSTEICIPPYDFLGMNLFLKQKARTKRELRKLQIAMLEVQFSIFVDSFDKKTIHKASVEAIKKGGY